MDAGKREGGGGTGRAGGLRDLSARSGHAGRVALLLPCHLWLLFLALSVRVRTAPGFN